MNTYKELLERGFKVIFYNKKDIDGYSLSSRMNYRLDLQYDEYKGNVDLIIELLGRDKYFWLKDVISLYIELSEGLEEAEIYYITDSDRETIDIKDKLEDILRLIPREYNYEDLDS